MSKVEMSLREYDELREKLRNYESIIKELTTPRIDDWELQYFKDHPGSSFRIYSRIENKENLEFLKSRINENISTCKELEGICGSFEPEFCMDTIPLFYVRSESIVVEDVDISEN